MALKEEVAAGRCGRSGSFGGWPLLLRLGVCGIAAAAEKYEGGFAGFRVSEREEMRIWELGKGREEGKKRGC